MKTSQKFTNGFTLIETMISISIFLIIITIGIGALLNANLVHRKSQDMRSIMDNLNFVMEDMSRNIRIGFNYQCLDNSVSYLDQSFLDSNPQNCENGWGLAFKSAETGYQWVYYVSNGRIYRSIEDLSNPTALTEGDGIVINPNSSGFSVIGAYLPPNGEQQPFVIIRLTGTITSKGNSTPFSIQTSVSQRLINI